MNVANDQVNTREDTISIAVPTKKRDLYYSTNHKKSGLAIIFNHKEFTCTPPLKTRYGTEADCLNLENTLQIIGFETRKYLDLSLKELIMEIDGLSQYDFSDCDCLLIAVLSHGEKDKIYARNSDYPPNILYDPFTPDKCPSLAGKPKLFVLQACRGNKLDSGVDIHTLKEDQVDSGVNLHTLKGESDTNDSLNRMPLFGADFLIADTSASLYRTPLFADFLFFCSTFPGYYSWRSEQKGSWFIQAFCKEMRRRWKEHDFLTILTCVNNRVAFDFEAIVEEEPSLPGMKQIPCINSMLTRLLKFTAKNHDNNNNNNHHD